MRPEELRQRRTAAHLTIAQLAGLADVSEDTISKIENGHRQGSPLTLSKLEAALSEAHPCQELLDAARYVLNLWDNVQDLGSEVYTPAYEALREAIQKAQR